MRRFTGASPRWRRSLPSDSHRCPSRVPLRPRAREPRERTHAARRAAASTAAHVSARRRRGGVSARFDAPPFLDHPPPRAHLPARMASKNVSPPRGPVPPLRLTAIARGTARNPRTKCGMSGTSRNSAAEQKTAKEKALGKYGEVCHRAASRPRLPRVFRRRVRSRICGGPTGCPNARRTQPFGKHDQVQAPRVTEFARQKEAVAAERGGATSAASTGRRSRRRRRSEEAPPPTTPLRSHRARAGDSAQAAGQDVGGDDQGDERAAVRWRLIGEREARAERAIGPEREDRRNARRWPMRGRERERGRGKETVVFWGGCWESTGARARDERRRTRRGTPNTSRRSSPRFSVEEEAIERAS